MTNDRIKELRGLCEKANTLGGRGNGKTLLILNIANAVPELLDVLEAAYAENERLKEHVRMGGQLSIELRKAGEQREAEKDAEIERLKGELAAAVECIPKTCANCAKRHGWDTCEEPAFISDGNVCLHFCYNPCAENAPSGAESEE